MSKPLNENLNAVRIETEDGDLIPVMEYAGSKFSDLIKDSTAARMPTRSKRASSTAKAAAN